ncbi:MAG: sulfur carrier protein [Candidatus Tokpelaia sp. JSC161]|jgi:sulfur carrier protein|nr:MAG: sulfur carrier protein [Candidatus Tokpelaia sp. JSC161]
MRVHVNGEEVDVRASFLSDLLNELGFQGDWFATAVNNEFVARDEHASKRIEENDRIEVLSPMQGG